MEYQIPDGLTADAVEQEIRDHLRSISQALCCNKTVYYINRIYYDTFDWAVYGAGGLLSRHAGTLEWTSRNGDVMCSQPQETEPGLAQALQAGPVRARIAGPCGVRRLLPVMRIETTTRLLRILNRNDQAVLRLLLDVNRFEDPDSGRVGDLSIRLRVESVRDFDKVWDTLVAPLEARLGLTATNTPLLLEALTAAGRRPADYSSKIDFLLDPKQRADTVIKQILLSLLDTLRANVEGAQANWDSEFLHDLRVATRRTRSVLSQIKGVLPDQEVAHYQERFAWLQQVTGTVRDLDVYLLAFDGYQASLPSPLRPQLEPLRSFLRTHYEKEQQALAIVLGSWSFANLLAEWRTFLTAPVPERSSLPNAMLPIKGVAEARIRSIAKRVRRQGRAINEGSPPEELHALRKRCKKLRYLLEFFQCFYPADRILLLIKQLKVLLDQLGDYQDRAVLAAHLEQYAVRMHTEDAATPGALLAMGALIGDLLSRQQKARARFPKVFAAFDDHRQWREYKALFWPSTAEDEAS